MSDEADVLIKVEAHERIHYQDEKTANALSATRMELTRLRAALATATEALRWRDVKVEPPEGCGYYLCSVSQYKYVPKIVYIELWGDGGLRIGALAVTHWLPLPPLPENKS